MEKHVIWQNRNIDFDQWAKDIIADNKDAAKWSEDEMCDYITDLNAMYLDDEILNLGHIVFDSPIIVIADLGLWHGRRQGYKLIESGQLADCLELDNDYMEFYVDARHNFRAISSHHDGTNYYLYRIWKENLSEEQKENFLDKIYRGEATSSDISRYTKRVGDAISKTYGWN